MTYTIKVHEKAFTSVMFVKLAMTKAKAIIVLILTNVLLLVVQCMRVCRFYVTIPKVYNNFSISTFTSSRHKILFRELSMRHLP